MSRNATTEGPDPIDVFVGSKIAQRRLILGYTQGDVAKALDLSFQQVQKYERGQNRISSSKLYAVALFLGCRVGDFFPEDDGHVVTPTPPKPLETRLLVTLRRFAAPFPAETEFEVSSHVSSRLLTFAVLAPEAAS